MGTVRGSIKDLQPKFMWVGDNAINIIAEAKGAASVEIRPDF